MPHKVGATASGPSGLVDRVGGCAFSIYEANSLLLGKLVDNSAPKQLGPTGRLRIRSVAVKPLYVSVQ